MATAGDGIGRGKTLAAHLRERRLVGDAHQLDGHFEDVLQVAVARIRDTVCAVRIAAQPGTEPTRFSPTTSSTAFPWSETANYRANHRIPSGTSLPGEAPGSNAYEADANDRIRHSEPPQTLGPEDS